MTNAVVVGGGISGIVAAVLLKKKFDHVSIIEATPTCGGLLKSIKDGAGLYYDQGTHIPDLTGIKEIDEILYGPEETREENWITLSHLPSGNYFNQQWNLETQTLNFGGLDNEIRSQVEDYILNEKYPDNLESLASYLSGRFGNTALRKVFEPIFQKLYGQYIRMEDLVAEIGGGRFFIFGLDRIIAFSKEEAAKLKRDPFFNEKIAFHTQEEFLQYLKHSGNDQKYLYPNGNRGIGEMIHNVIERMQQLGVTVKTNATVKEITAEGEYVHSVTLNDGETLQCDYLFWSIPPAFALRAAGRELPKTKIETRCSNIFHYCFDRPIRNKSSHFLWSWDHKNPVFRITLYDNFRPPSRNGHHQISVECLSGNDDFEKLSSELIHQTLIDMELVDTNTQILSKVEQRLKNTFPVPTHSFKVASEFCYKDLTSHFKNIDVSGRFSGKVWLQSEVLAHTFELINNIHQK